MEISPEEIWDFYIFRTGASKMKIVVDNKYLQKVEF